MTRNEEDEQLRCALFANGPSYARCGEREKNQARDEDPEGSHQAGRERAEPDKECGKAGSNCAHAKEDGGEKAALMLEGHRRKVF